MANVASGYLLTFYKCFTTLSLLFLVSGYLQDLLWEYCEGAGVDNKFLLDLDDWTVPSGSVTMPRELYN